MENPIILSKPEEEHLVRALEGALHVQTLPHFFRWAQGQLQGLLPHEIMICIQFAENDEVRRIECVSSIVHNPGTINRLCDQADGLVVRLARCYRSSLSRPCAIGQLNREDQHPLSTFHAEIEQCRLGNAVVHGTGRLQGGGTFFALFSLPGEPEARQEYFLELLLPSMHLAFLRVASLGDGEEAGKGSAPTPLLTAREIEVVQWVSKGKSNYEIGVILALSTLTVKNHMQKIFRKLKVHNRMQAASISQALQLLDTPKPQARFPGRHRDRHVIDPASIKPQTVIRGELVEP